MKNTVPNHIDFYPQQRFSCRRCGYCCRLAIKITGEEADRLKKTMLPSGKYPPAEWFIASPSQPSAFVVAKTANGECVFREAGGGCVLHEIKAKPLICRVFPLYIVNWKDGHCSASLRFLCPGVGNTSATLMEHQPEIITEVAGLLRERIATGSVEYSNENPASLTALRHVHAGYKAILHDETMPLKLRLYALSRIIDFHAAKDNYNAVSAANAGFAADATSFTRKAVPVLSAELIKGTASFKDIIDFRILLTGYLRDDDPLTVKSSSLRLKMLCAHSIFAAGGGNLRRINPQAPDIGGKQILNLSSRTTLDEPALEIFRQFFYGRLDAMHFCGDIINDLSYEMGIRHLLLSIPVTFAIAAAFARANRKNVIGEDEMLSAVRLLDLTFRHSQFFRLKLTRKMLKRLSRPSVFAGILNLVFGRKLKL